MHAGRVIAVLLPTTGRPEMARRCVDGLIATTDGHDLEIVAAIDADNKTPAVLRDVFASAPRRVRGHIDYSTPYRGCSRAWNDALAASSGDPVIFAADDLSWEPGWLDAALETLDGFAGGWGLVGFNDGHWGPELSTHYLMSRRFILDVLGGVVAWDFYRHSFNDLEVNERAKRAGRYAWCEHARVRHAHWIFGDRPQDATDTRTLGEHAASERIYRQREAAGFPVDYKPAITM